MSQCKLCVLAQDWLPSAQAAVQQIKSAHGITCCAVAAGEGRARRGKRGRGRGRPRRPGMMGDAGLRRRSRSEGLSQGLDAGKRPMRTLPGQMPPQLQQPAGLQPQLSGGGLNSSKGRATPRSVGTKVTGPGVPQPMFAPTSSAAAYQHHFQRKRGGKTPRGTTPAFGASRAGSAKGKGLLDEAAEALLGMGMDIEDASMQVGLCALPRTTASPAL
jgi:hypothetical protein